MLVKKRGGVKCSRDGARFRYFDIDWPFHFWVIWRYREEAKSLLTGALYHIIGWKRIWKGPEEHNNAITKSVKKRDVA